MMNLFAHFFSGIDYTALSFWILIINLLLLIISYLLVAY
jgi:hypothetical protein